MAGRVEVRLGGTRPASRGAGTLALHSCSFGDHYDPADVGFGLLVAHNDEHVEPGGGYREHRHRDVEVVTWVVEGTLRHRHRPLDADGTPRGAVEHLLGAGGVQAMYAGAGVSHSETEAGTGRPLRFVQAWLPAADPDRPPSATSADVGSALAAGGLVPVAAGPGRPTPGVPLVHPGAVLHVARPRAPVRLPGAPYVHVFVARGAVTLAGAGRLGEGDAVRLTDVSTPQVLEPVGPGEPAEVLVWEMHRGPGRGGQCSSDSAWSGTYCWVSRGGRR